MRLEAFSINKDRVFEKREEDNDDMIRKCILSSSLSVSLFFLYCLWCKYKVFKDRDTDGLIKKKEERDVLIRKRIISSSSFFIVIIIILVM